MSTIESSREGPESRARDYWRIRGRTITIDRPLVFGILNVTPDSFSDGGQFESAAGALAQTERMVDEGADGIDVGGESTRPQGAKRVSATDELRRVVPIVREIRARFPVLPISVDTTKSEVASAALDEGADIVNDVSAFRIDPRLGDVAAASGCGVVLMHSRGSVEEMGTYRYAEYGADIVADVVSELSDSLRVALGRGVTQPAIVLDPGIGFAKRSAHSLRVLSELRRIEVLGCPIMVGVSRKRFIGELSGVPEARERIAGSVGASVAALMRGARLFRVHDVAPNRQALDVAWGVVRAGQLKSGDDSVDLRTHPRSRFPVPGSRRA